MDVPVLKCMGRRLFSWAHYKELISVTGPAEGMPEDGHKFSVRNLEILMTLTVKSTVVWVEESRSLVHACFSSLTLGIEEVLSFEVSLSF
jgi:hypothetical protein